MAITPPMDLTEVVPAAPRHRFITDVITFDSPPPPAAFYSLSQRGLTFVGLSNNFGPGRVLSEVILLDLWAKGNGDPIIGKWRRGVPFLDVGDGGRIAAFWPDEIIVTGASAPGDIFHIAPDPNKTSPACDARFDAKFYPGPGGTYPSVSWCKNKLLAHFDAGIVALAGYATSPFRHAIVATATGDVVGLAF